MAPPVDSSDNASVTLTAVPRLTPTARTTAMRSLPLSPMDGFVLSYIDGTRTGEAIVDGSGMDASDVLDSLLILFRLGLIEVGAAPAPTPSPVPPEVDAGLKRTISGAYAQVSPDRPSQRARALAAASVRASSPPPPPASTRPVSVRPLLDTSANRAFDGSAGPASTPPPISSRPSPSRSVAPASVSRPSVAPGPPPSSPASSPSAGVAATDVDLEPELRARIDELYGALQDLDFYALLQVDRAADKKAIKRAYYEIATNFHPDKHFRKSLGPYKARMEAIFGRFTLAHDTLTSRTDRADYDSYLGVRASVSDHEARLASASDDIRRAEQDAARAAQHAATATPAAPASRPSGAMVTASAAPPISSPHAGPVSSRTPAVVPAAPVSSPSPRAPVSGTTKAAAPSSGGPLTTPSNNLNVQAAREALARKLLGGAIRPSTSTMAAAARHVSEPAPPSGPSMSPRDAVDALKRRYEERITDSRSSQVARYRAAGEADIAKGELIAGLNSLRVALSFDPENVELTTLTLATQRKADEVLSASYEQKATYEEKQENWIEAGKSWSKVARARPNDAQAHDRAAFCILRAKGPLREASELAKRAVSLDLQNGTYRATLGAVYLAGNMLLNARREIEAAHQLDPENPAVVAAMRRLREQG